jgi:hypothetical protein
MYKLLEHLLLLSEQYYCRERKTVTHMNKLILLELMKLLRQRGEVTKEQREYARVEVQVMKEMYPKKESIEEAGLSRYNP